MSEDDLALQMVRKMCKTDRFAGRDEDYDDRCMEANFDDIMREEKRRYVIIYSHVFNVVLESSRDTNVLVCLLFDTVRDLRRKKTRNNCGW